MGKSIEVILLNDVPELGRSGDTCRVRAGYARNFLFPNQLATTMTAGTKRLIEKKRADILPDIAYEMRVMVDKDQNISHGSIVSAIVLDQALLDKIQGTLEKLTGNRVILETQVDPSIIGGIIAKVGDLVLDGSIKTQLNGLKESIKGRE